MRKMYLRVMALVLALSGGLIGTVFADQRGQMVYTMSNASSGNAVLAFEQRGDTLIPAGSFPTQGTGSGGGLGNQGAIVLSDDGDTLLAVNAGSDEVSVFRVHANGLTLADKVSSGGVRPISIAVHEDWVYVLNAGGSGIGNITGFVLTSRDTLKPIPGSTRPLSGPATAPAQVEFNPEGDTLVVTEKATRIIDTYTVDDDGIATGPVSHASSGITPFGFSFNKRGILIVSEAFGGAANASAVSSYALHQGSLRLLSASVPDLQSAVCWIVVTKNGKFAFGSNTGSNNISSYRVGRDGTLTLLASVAASTGAAPIDMALRGNSKFLYVLNATAHTIDVLRVDRGNGQLTPVTSVAGLPAGANGLVAR
ncbi:MAG: lactonase family protein [Nitrospira sp.]|nr:MAG: lactonase family protein [Nitrospira sp.]